MVTGGSWVRVTITSIDPPSTTSGGRTINGSMINPSPAFGMRQGYDSEMYDKYKSSNTYDPALNVALGVSAANPLVVAPHSSLVSTESVGAAGNRPQIKKAQILTVVDQVPPDGSFRPAYCGTDKSAVFNKTQLDYSLLASLPAVPGTPSLSSIERKFERPWIDHVPDWIARYTHPSENMQDYGRDFGDDVSIGALMLHLDFTNAQKERLLIRYVQLGIDWYGVVANEGANNWPPAGGHNHGRKWPILFAGLMLGDAAMGGIAGSEAVFAEDGQTFYVMETSPGVYNNGYGGYGAQHVGLAEWGQKHTVDPSLDDVNWTGDPYRTCCTANSWYGFVLAIRIMGVQSLWNHDSIFDYQDRYLSTTRSLGQSSSQISWSAFPLEMWDRYRSSF